MLMCGCGRGGVRACVRVQSARYAPCRTASLFLADHHSFDVVNLTFPYFTHTGAPQCLCVSVRCVRACARNPRAIRARYAPCRTASLFLAHHQSFDVVNLTFPNFTHTGAPQCLCVGVGGCVRACARNPRAIRARYEPCRTASLFLVIITILTLLISLFPTLLTLRLAVP
jgi:hypothetical protein